MDYAFLPPEITSARMYTGPGSGAMLAAAGSWDSLSAELSTTAEGYESTLSHLTSFGWRGAASEAMTATAARYTRWLQTAAEQTKQTAMQARAAAAAYEHAHATTVPPAAVAANRTRLAALIATNIVGHNSAAIAATEAQYCDYWAQDSAAMSGYAASSTAATTQLPSFNSPNQTTTTNAQSAQNNAVTQSRQQRHQHYPGHSGAVDGGEFPDSAEQPHRPRRLHRARRHRGLLWRHQFHLQHRGLRVRNHRRREQLGYYPRCRRGGGRRSGRDRPGARFSTTTRCIGRRRCWPGRDIRHLDQRRQGRGDVGSGELVPLRSQITSRRSNRLA